MDPDAALAKLRELLDAKAVDRLIDLTPSPEQELGDVLNEVCDVFAGLDQWIANGGFLPQAWAAKRG